MSSLLKRERSTTRTGLLHCPSSRWPNERFLIGNHFSSVSRQARPSLSPNRSSTRKTSWLRLDGTIDGICKLRWIGLGDANTRIEPARLSYEQLGAGQGEPHIGA